MRPEGVRVCLAAVMRPQLLFLCPSLFLLYNTLAPRAPNRRASMHRRGALTSLLRARTGLRPCLSERPTVMSGVEAQWDLTWTAARTFVFYQTLSISISWRVQIIHIITSVMKPF